MNIRQNILANLKGENTQKLPLTIYTADGSRGSVKLLYEGEYERELRNRGLGLIFRASAYNVYNNDLVISERKIRKDGNLYIKTTWRIDNEEIDKISRAEPGYNTYFTEKKFIQKDKDYEILNNILKGKKFLPNYKRIKIIDRNLKSDGLVMIRANKTAYNRLIYRLVNIEKFVEDLYQDNPYLLNLMDTLNNKNKEAMKIIADAPAEIVQISDNITAPMIGGKRFKKYCLPFYDWAKKLLPKDKLLCVHMDGNLKNIVEEIAETKLSIIEGFTPPPDGDLGLEEACNYWPEKVIWLNFPSSIHVKSSEEIKTSTENLLKKSEGNSILFGITEDIPEKHWYKSLSAILDVLNTTKFK